MTETPELKPEDFPSFFRAMQTWTGAAWDATRVVFDPFPWQSRLIPEIIAAGRWPDLLDLPTGSGKTVAIDIAVFHLAIQADWGERRRAAMRIAFVVDRRLVVDDAFLRARRLAEALAAADRSDAPDVVRRVALRLRGLAGAEEAPLVARSLRGGAPREDDWARTPCQPTVLCSTVDQVGSRLLFRGYGVADRAKSIHAGLLGSDALLLLDEAHLSRPFRQTARAIATVPSLRGVDGEGAVFQVALLTATPGEENPDEWRFNLGEDDRRNPVLAKRLLAAKPVTCVEVGGDRAHARAAADQAKTLMRHLERDGVDAPIIGVVLNRIARARETFEILRAELGEHAVTLVVGRARSVDRDLIAQHLRPIKTGVEPRPSKAHVVVATQALEAGVDIDLDGLVTDAAPLDALRQRFGRMNRAGRSVAARGVILAEKADRNERKSDPIYGVATAHTLAKIFPTGEETVDFGILALSSLLGEFGLSGAALSPLLSEGSDAPILMPAYVDLWTHTSPMPLSDPDPALFLHGPDREPASVQVVWRADIGAALDPADDAQSERLRRLMALAPPRAAEAMELSVWAARRWLSGESGTDLADIVQAEPAASASYSKAWAAFRWRGVDSDRSRVIWPDDIGPGDLIVVPSNYGGCDQFGWAPDHRQMPESQRPSTTDVYDAASSPFAGKRLVVRVEPGLIRQAVFAGATEEDRDAAETQEAVNRRLEAKSNAIIAELAAVLSDPEVANRGDDLARTLATILPEPLRGRVAALARARRHRLERPVYPYDLPEAHRWGVVFIAPFGVDGATGADDESSVSTEDDEAGSFIGHAQSLAEHSSEVEARARSFARSAGLGDPLVEDLALAGWLHDAGKADLRFQRLLFDGDLLAMEAGSPRAKSDRGRAPPGAWARARLPDKWRHEALSVRLALLNARLHMAQDRALVLWLVGVHHGLGRPFFPHADPADRTRRELAVVESLSERALHPGAGPQSAGFHIPEEAAFGPRVGRGFDDDLRGLDWATLFRDLKRRYGPWGLARLEAVLRLADHRASEAARNRAGDR